MKSKVIMFLIMLMSLLSGFSQRKYPIQTMFKGDSVVILKYEQAQSINNLLNEKNSVIEENNTSIKKYSKKVSHLQDTIVNLKSDLFTTKNILSEKMSLVKSKNDTILFVNHNLDLANQKIQFYEKEMKRIEKLEWIEKRTRTQMKVGIVGVLVTWVVFSIAALHQ